MTFLISSVLVFLSLLAVHQAADPNCEDVIKPSVLEDSVIGKWLLIEGISNNPKLTNILKMMNSSWMEFSPGLSKDTLILRRGGMLHGDCQISSMNITFKNSTFYASVNNVTIVIDLLHSCSDCMTLSFRRQMENTTMRSLFLLTKRPKASESEMDLYWKQAECLGFKREPQFSYDGVTGQCHIDEKHSAESHTKPEPEKKDE
ncbi:hypothetical protein SRHO_G00125630 [Serrasalmus rhombeus]